LPKPWPPTDPEDFSLTKDVYAMAIACITGDHPGMDELLKPYRKADGGIEQALLGAFIGLISVLVEDLIRHVPELEGFDVEGALRHAALRVAEAEA
jgi:hypothetical protein